MSFFHKITSVILSIIILISTSSFAVESHYCGDTLIDISVFGKAENCKMTTFVSDKKNNSCIIKDDYCCSNKVVIHENNNSIDVTTNLFSFQNTVFLYSYFYSYKKLFEDLKNNIIPFKYYSPPLLVTDIQVTQQSFLI